LRSDDVILAVDQKAVTTLEEMRLVISEYAPNSRVAMRVLRKGAPLVVTVTLGEADDNPNALVTGVTVQVLTDADRAQLGIDGRIGGLLITAVADDSPFADRLTKNMVIVAINRTVVSDLATARSLLQNGRNLFLVYYQGGLTYLTVPIRN
jgi:S1-C subfamily serine protease